MRHYRSPSALALASMNVHFPEQRWHGDERPSARVGLYRRQSRGSHDSTSSVDFQMICLRQRLTELGWHEEQFMITQPDIHVSGTLPMERRPGMSALLDLIRSRTVDAVAAVHVDRLFRDSQQIETNQFIDLCRRLEVPVITMNFIFDFADPLTGRHHMLLFREQAEQAAEFLMTQVYERATRARERLVAKGAWLASITPIGLMADQRRLLADNQPNPAWRQLLPYEPYWQVVKEYFAIADRQGANIKATLAHIEQFGPFFPEASEITIPAGYHMRCKISTRSKVTQGLMLSRNALIRTLTNAYFAGHCVARHVVTRWNDHEPLIDPDLFNRLFNRLSLQSLDGGPNLNYVDVHNHPNIVSPAKQSLLPTYLGLVHTVNRDRLVALRYCRMKGPANFAYSVQFHTAELESGRQKRRSRWTVEKRFVDPLVDALLLKRLTEIAQRLEEGQRRLQQHQQFAGSVIDPVSRSEWRDPSRLEDPDSVIDLELLSMRLKSLKASITSSTISVDTILQPGYEMLITVIAEWSRLTATQRRQLAESCVESIVVTRQEESSLYEIRIRWHDQTESVDYARRSALAPLWSKYELARLINLVHQGASKQAILAVLPGRSWVAIKKKLSVHGIKR